MISIIMPIYNAQATLEKCLDSLQKQTYTDIEVIMIDDGSSDRSAEICNKFSKADSRFKYHYQKNAGVSAARNKGLDLAQGNYIGFCDADDWVDADMCELLHALLRQTGADVAICSCYVDTKTVHQSKHAAKEYTLYTGKEAFVEMNRGTHFQGHLWNKLFKRECIGELRFQQDVFYLEDGLFCAQVMAGCANIVFQDVTLYHYVQQESSAMHTYRERIWSIQTASERMCQMMEVYSPENIAIAQKNAVIANLILARRVAEARVLNTERYNRIRKHLDTKLVPAAVDMLSPSDTRELKFFKCGRRLYSVYVRLLVVCKRLLNR